MGTANPVLNPYAYCPICGVKFRKDKAHECSKRALNYIDRREKRGGPDEFNMSEFLEKVLGETEIKRAYDDVKRAQLDYGTRDRLDDYDPTRLARE